MSKVKSFYVNSLSFLAMLVVVTACSNQPTQTKSISSPAEEEAFLVMIEVIKSPRCMNCHTVTDFPRQNDDRTQHQFNVRRGADDQGVPGMKCSSCHQETNNDVAGLPGAPHWGLAPLSMAWEKMSDREICLQLKDRSRNGNKSLADIEVHMTEDALVQWAWQPGLHPGGKPRSLPPFEVEAFHAAVTNWVEYGGPCPAE